MSDSILGGAAAPVTPPQAPPATGTVVDLPGSGAAQPTWRDSLAADLKGDPSINKFNSVDDLAKSYVSLQKTLGVDKMPIPGAKSSDQDWRQTFQKLGLPETLDKYEVKGPDSSKLDTDFMNQFKAKAFEAGILPKQAEQMASWMAEVTGQTEASIEQQIAQARDEGIKNLKTEWGEAWDQKVQVAINAVDAFGGDEVKAYLAETGLGNDPAVIKFMAKIGEALTEDKVRGQGDARISGALTPAEANSKISQIMGDTKHAYWDGSHSEHKSAMAEMERLMKFAHGNS